MPDVSEVLASEYAFIENYIEKTRKVSDFIKARIDKKEKEFVPEVALTLGSSWDEIKEIIDVKLTIPYHEIPSMVETTVEGHKGELIVGSIEGVPVIVFVGRKHFYEMAHMPTGMIRTVLPVHIAANLGAKVYFATNAAGGLNADFSVGDLMIVESHLNMMPNPLLGTFYDFGGTEFFPSLSNIYSKKLNGLLEKAAKDAGAKIHRGVYYALTGKSYETKAECLLFRNVFKADAVGMSTVPEIIVAASRKMDTVAMSLISNVIDEDGNNEASHEEVLKALSNKDVREALIKTVRGFFKLYGGK